MEFYKRFPREWLDGVRALTLEQRGAYDTVLELIYRSDDHLHDDDRFIAGFLNCDLRVWKRLKADLIRLGKLHTDAGWLRNVPASIVIDAALANGLRNAELNRIKALKSWATRNKNKDLAMMTAKPMQSRSPFLSLSSSLSSSLEDSLKERKEDSEEQAKGRAASWNFDEFWLQYPRKVAKRTAQKAFAAARKRAKVSFLDVMAALMRYAAKTDDRPWCYASTWLNGDRWLDDPSTNKQASNGGQHDRRTLVEKGLDICADLEQRDNDKHRSNEGGDFFDWPISKHNERR